MEKVFPNAKDVWLYRAEVLGFIPRYVVEKTSEDANETILVACKSCTLDQCFSAVGEHGTIGDKSLDILHRIVHLISESPYRKCVLAFASSAALDVIIYQHGLNNKRKLLTLLKSDEGISRLAATYGLFYEPYAMDQLERGGDFKCRQLVDKRMKKTSEKPEKPELKITGSEKVRVVAEKVEVGQTQLQLHVPRSKNYPGIDAWIPGVGGFQMTVGKSHTLHSKVSSDLAKLGAGAANLYWILPPFHYNSFPRPTTPIECKFDQYALRIPYPELEELLKVKSLDVEHRAQEKSATNSDDNDVPDWKKKALDSDSMAAPFGGD